MMNIKKNVYLKHVSILKAAVLVFVFAVGASASGGGGLAGAWLKAPVGADALSKGGATGADASHLFSWSNPALLVKYRESRLAMGGSYKSLGRAEGVLACEFRVPPRVGMGVSVLYRGNPVLDNLHDADGFVLETGSFSTLTLKIGLAYMINRKLSVGGNVSAFYLNMPVDYIGNQLMTESAIDMGGFDLGARFEASGKVCFGLIVKNIGAGMTVTAKGYSDFNVPVETVFPAVFTAASRVIFTLTKKPFIWTCDLDGYVIDGSFGRISHPFAMLDNGFEWQKWDNFYIRAGLRDISFNGDILSNSDRYSDDFTFAVSTGFYLDLSSVVKGLSVNYALSTDKIWAGVENVCDFLYVF